MFGKQYDFLRCDPKLALKIQHPPVYKKHGEKEYAIRNIFHNQELDKFEKDNLTSLDFEIQRIGGGGLYNHEITRNTGELLKFLYSKKFDINETLICLINHIEWLMEKNNYELTPGA